MGQKHHITTDEIHVFIDSFEGIPSFLPSFLHRFALESSSRSTHGEIYLSTIYDTLVYIETYALYMGNICSGQGASTSASSSDHAKKEANVTSVKGGLRREPTFSKVHARLREDCKVRDAYKIGKTYVFG